jgi:hypothetical protein
MWRLLVLLLVPFLCAWGTTTTQGGDQIVTYYVNGSSGNDGNTGLSTSEAWLTLGQAETVIGAVKNSGKRVILVIEGGTYREDLFDESAGALFTGDAEIEFVGSGAVIIKGSDLTTSVNWSLETGLCSGADCYSHAWTNNWGVQAPPGGWPATDDIVLRREMVFVDGTLYRQYLTEAEMEANEESFYVNEAPGTDAIYIHLPTSTVPANYTIELAERETAFQTLNGKNIRLRNLTFQHFANLVQKGTVHTINGDNVLVTNSAASWNSNSGFSFTYSGAGTTSNVVMRNVDNTYNGIHGMGFTRVDTALLQNVESSYHNWRGAWGSHYDVSASNKFYSTRDITIEDFTATGNQANGLWFDYDNKRASIDGCTVEDSYENGLYFEASQGPITITDCVVENNRLAGALWANADYVSLDDVTLDENWTEATTVTQILISGTVGGRVVTDRDGGSDTVYSENATLTNSTITGTTDYLIRGYLGGAPSADYNRFLDTFNSDYNAWSNTSTDVFSPYDKTPLQVNFATWQANGAQIGEDTNSTWTPLP